jgi:hypothetical protein
MPTTGVKLLVSPRDGSGSTAWDFGRCRLIQCRMAGRGYICFGWSGGWLFLLFEISFSCPTASLGRDLSLDDMRGNAAIAQFTG